jgi:hypothetical protein
MWVRSKFWRSKEFWKSPRATILEGFCPWLHCREGS